MGHITRCGRKAMQPQLLHDYLYAFSPDEELLHICPSLHPAQDYITAQGSIMCKGASGPVMLAASLLAYWIHAASHFVLRCRSPSMTHELQKSLPASWATPGWSIARPGSVEQVGQERSCARNIMCGLG